MILFYPPKALAEIPELMGHLRRNYQFWKEQEEASKNISSQTPPALTANEEESHEEETTNEMTEKSTGEDTSTQKETS